MSRSLAMHDAGMWTGVVDTEPGSVSGWHHHGEHETTLYVVSGRMRIESGPDGAEVVEGGPGDFLRVPAGAVHRESNPGGEHGARGHRPLRHRRPHDQRRGAGRLLRRSPGTGVAGSPVSRGSRPL